MRITDITAAHAPTHTEAQVEAEAEAEAEAEVLTMRLRERHKKLFTSVVMPVILGTTVFLIATHWRNEFTFFSGLGVVLLLDVFNVYFSIKNRVLKTRFGTIESRSDGFDTMRWCLTLIGDAYIIFALGASTSEAFAIWLILTFGALTEVYLPRNRVITSAFALAGLVAVLALTGATLLHSIYLVACFVGLIAILIQMERWIFKEMQSYHGEILEKEQFRRKSEAVMREAIVGNQARMIVHEVNNMLFIIKNASALEALAKTEENKNLNRIKRSVDILSRLGRLVLDDLPGQDSAPRQLGVDDLGKDLALLLAKQFSESGLTFTLDWRAAASDLSMTELPGTTYLILHNLVKNACEAVATKFDGQPGGAVSMTSELAPTANGRKLAIRIKDNGPGMTTDKIAAILEEKAETSKTNGHGLGLKFTMQFVRRNSYDIGITSAPNAGTEIVLSIPLKSTQAALDKAS